MLRALVAEDDPLVLELVVFELGDAGFAVTEAGDADGALGILAADPDFDLLLTDVRMPGSIDGWELGRQARALAPRLAVIYATASIEPVPALTERERHLQKPYSTRTLLETLRSLQLA